MAPAIEALLFDLDGTVIDHDTAAGVALARALRGLPGLRQVDHAHVRRRWKDLEDVAMERYLSGELTFADQRRLRATGLAAELGLGAWDAQQADAWFAGYLRHYEDAWRAYPDVRPALAAFAERHRRLRMGVLTNGEADQQRAKLRRVGLAAELPVVIVSSEAGAAKPSPEIFHTACVRLGLAPAKVAYVGDRLRTDAVAATDAGLYGIWLNRHDDPAPTWSPTIRTLEELPVVLRGFLT